MKHRFYKENTLLAKYYDQHCKKYGKSTEAIGWFSKKTQDLRFMILSLIGNINDKTVLDIGCGQGDYYGYCLQNKFKPKYKGIDISKQMIIHSHREYPESDFRQTDFMSPDFNEQHDYIIASGTFNNKMTNQKYYLKTAVTKMFQLANKGVSFNLLSEYAPERMKFQNDFFYYNPEQIAGMCFKITRYIEIRHSYLPNDFTVYMYK